MARKGKIRKEAARGIPVSTKMKSNIQSLRQSRGLTIDQLSNETGISSKTLQKLENPNNPQQRFDENTLYEVARVFGIGINDLDKNIPADDMPHSFDYLFMKFKEIDEKLLPLIRDHRHTPIELVEQEHSNLLDSYLSKFNASLDSIEHYMHSPTYISTFLNSVPNPDITVDIANDFRKISFNLSHEDSLIVKNPYLLWDCHCNTPSINIDKSQCPIHSSPLADDVYSNFRYGNVLLRFRNLYFHWRCCQELWPPSIDSFHMMKNLELDGVLSSKYHSILDLGSGTGFLGICISSINKHVTNLTLSDWLLLPCLYGYTNWLLNNGKRRHVTCDVKVGLFTNHLGPRFKPYDVVICNPPYLPLLDGYDDLGLESTVAGTALLEHVLSANKALGKRVYIQFSHLALPEVKQAQKTSGIKLRPIGKAKQIPFRLSILHDRKDYLNVLVNDRGLIYKDSRHPYWHRIQTYLIE